MGVIIEVKVISNINKGFWLFRDSLQLLPSNLDNLSAANQFNVPNKNNQDYVGATPNQEFYNSGAVIIAKDVCSLKEQTLEYLNSDLLCLYQVLEKFNNELIDLYKIGIKDAITLPSLFLKIWKTHYYKEEHKVPIIKLDLYDSFS